ncbi:MAG: CinA family protein [Bacilli bacterium]|nr:CinA family protein [Bacilli bacterium]
MLEKAERVVNLLIERKEQIATMESCTGGGLANMITNIPGASEILLYSAVTYSNEYKIKMGVLKETIDKYTVYSMETATEMARAISTFAHSDYGVGITGKLKRSDPNNITENDDLVYFVIYDRNKDLFYKDSLSVTKEERVENKDMVIEKVLDGLIEAIKK